MTEATGVRSRRTLEPTLIFGSCLFVALLVLNLITNPGTFSAASLPATIGFAAPVILAAFAATPPILLGNGGIDISVGPAMGLVNVVVVALLITRAGISSPALIIPMAILIGVLIGAVNGLIVALLRVPPIVVTLGMYLVATGLALVIAPTPGGTVPEWLSALAGSWSFVLIGAGLAVWALFRLTPLYEYLMAYGGDERAVFTTGIDVRVVRVSAFVAGGFFSGLGGLALSGMLGSADPNVGANYTMLGIAAAALGGVSLMGGRGGLFRALIGALSIFLLQNLLTYFNVSSFVLQFAYGATLVLAVAINGMLSGLFARKAEHSE